MRSPTAEATDFSRGRYVGNYIVVRCKLKERFQMPILSQT